MTLRYQCYFGSDIAGVVGDLAQLRISVFRDWPYLYDGNLAYERTYLARYARPGAIVVAAFDGPRIVGASTGMPLMDHEDDFADAFRTSGIDLSKTFYCAESILLSQFRGQGAGQIFFENRERHARSEGFRYATFCTVIRPDDHPARPDDYKPLDGLWRGRGYAPLDGVVARYHWRDVGDSESTEKQLQFWMKDL